MSLVSNADNAKITALGIIKLSNKGLIFSKDFNIIPFKNKLTTIIDSKVYCKKKLKKLDIVQEKQLYLKAKNLSETV